jgi:hypothetical protein
MEYKSSIKSAPIAILLLVYGCGYFENDRTEFQKTIVGNIKLQKQENTKVENLVFAETNEIFAVIVEDCKVVYHDSINKKIFAEGFINDTNSNYYQIELKDVLSKSVSTAIKKVNIGYEEYSNQIKNLTPSQ